MLHVRLADVNAVGAGGERDIDAVVDHQRHAGRAEDRFQAAGQLDEVPSGAFLIAKLDGAHSAAQGGADHVLDRARRRETRIDDQV